MTYQKNTWRQHYISQAEQRLNSHDGKHIYSFDVVDRDSFYVVPSTPHKVSIKNNLYDKHLYTFDKINDEEFLNFEHQFQKIENNINQSTTSLIDKIRQGDNNILSEVFNIFSAKQLNFIRNPYSIKKVINTYGLLTESHFTDQKLYGLGQTINAIKDQDIGDRASAYNVTTHEYKKWLYIIFMALAQHTKKDNFLTKTIYSLLKDQHFINHALIFKYSNHSPVLLDRGVINYENEGTYIFYANLNMSSFIQLSFTNIHEYSKKYSSVKNLDQISDALVNAGPQLSCRMYTDLMDHLSAFNKESISHSHNNIYCATKHIYTN